MKRFLLPLMLLPMLLTGCGSITGFSNAKTDFGCADLSGGPTCRNISTVYEENNPTASAAPLASASSTGEASIDEILQAIDSPNRKDFVTVTPAKPWRKPDTVLRVWLAPFTDKDGDLHDQRYLYVRLKNGGWTTESVQELANASRVHRPVYPLAPTEEPTKEDKKRENLKKLPAFGFTNAASAAAASL